VTDGRCQRTEGIEGGIRNAGCGKIRIWVIGIGDLGIDP
jgi:hypothetical protein